jgi:TonB family protein
MEAFETDEIRVGRLMRRQSPPSRSPFRVASSSNGTTVRWAVPGLALDLLRVAGCKPSSAEEIILGSAEYGAQGLLQRGSVVKLGLSPSCETVARAALALNVAPVGRNTADEERRPILVVLERETLDCMKDWPSDRGGVAAPRIGSTSLVRAPKKLKNITPYYPRAAQDEGVQGVVVLDATITPQGCVADVEIVRSVAGLDVSAVASVLRWRYTPTTIDGQAVPVVMTVTVNYSLR